MVCAPIKGQRGTGGGGGTHFETGVNNSGIKKIVTRFGKYEGHAYGRPVILLIHLEFRDGTVMEQGGRKHSDEMGHTEHEFELDRLETINKVDVWGDWLVDGVRFETNTGRSSGIICRMLDDDRCKTYSGDSLVGMFGGVGGILDRVGFEFGKHRNIRAYYNVRVEFQQRWVMETSFHSKRVECTAESEKQLKEIDQSSSFREAILPKWSKSAKAVWNKVLDTPHLASSEKDVWMKLHNTGSWQLFRVVTFTFSIDGASKTVQETAHAGSSGNVAALPESDFAERAEASLYSFLPENGIVSGYLRKSNPCVYHEDLFLIEKKELQCHV